MGAVEPSWEKAIEPLEHDTDGAIGPGLGLELRLECCELDIIERRLIQDVLLEGGFIVTSTSSTSFSPGDGQPLTKMLLRRKEVSTLDILLTSRRCCRRPSLLCRVAGGAREEAERRRGGL
jgi:hypothetical protein